MAQDKYTILKCNEGKPYVFVSYSSRDKDVVWADVAELQKRGYNVWIDRENFHKVNDSWTEDALEAITDPNCSMVIFYVSRHSLTSEPCYRELMATRSQEAMIARKSRQKLGFIAVEAEPISNIVDFRDEIIEEIITNRNIRLNENCEESSRSGIKEEAKNKMRVLHTFVEDFFNSNNERVRVHAKAGEQDAGRYYYDITGELPKETCNREGMPEVPHKAEALPKVEAAVRKVEETVVSAGEKPAEAHQKRAFSTTGNITYSLYGETYTENQSDMMLRFFAQVLKQHPEFVRDLPSYKGMNCVSAEDYTNPANVTDKMPSYFRVCRYFRYDNGAAICVGTSYSAADKLKKMALLLQIVGEDPSVFSSEQVELPAVKTKADKTASAGKGKAGKAEKQFL